MSLPPRLATLLQASLVADSLALPVHWLYDPAAIEGDFGPVTDLQAPPASSYHKGQPLGGQTHYGHQALALMASLQGQSSFDAERFGDQWQRLWATSDSYRDGATKATLANRQAGMPVQDAGSPSSDLGGAVRLAPLLVAMAAAPEATVVAAAQAQTGLTHRDPAVLDAAAFLVRAVRALLADASLPAALKQAAEAPYEALPVRAALQAAETAATSDPTAAVHALGAACAVSGAFPAALAIALAYPTDLEGALIANTMAGGDSAARGMMIGMLLGAQAGATVPDRWLQAWQARPQVKAFLAG